MELGRERMKDTQILGRCREVEEMAKLLSFLISEDNTFMTGSNVVSDGGFALQPPNMDRAD